MSTEDQFHPIASRILLSNAALALTWAHIAGSLPEIESRTTSMRRAALEYRRICEAICFVRMNDQNLRALGVMLLDLKAALDAPRLAAGSL